MSKDLVNMGFDELVAFATHIALDDIVEGTSLGKRVYKIVDIATRWAYLQQDREKCLQPKATSQSDNVRPCVSQAVISRQKEYLKRLEALPQKSSRSKSQKKQDEVLRTVQVALCTTEKS